MRLVMVTALAVLTALAVAPRGVAAGFHCGNVRLDRFLRPDPNGDFGAFDVTRTDTTCKTARRIASRYVRDPRSIDRAKRIEGWTCTKRNVDAQVVWVTCTRKGASPARITFVNWLPSG